MRLVASIAAVLIAAFIMGADSPSAHAEELQITNDSTKVVVIEPGDSLSKIASNHASTYKRLYEANTEIKHPDLIYPDHKLRIPTADEQLPERPMPVDAQLPVENPAPKRTQARTSVTQDPSVKPKLAAPKAVVGGNIWDRLAQCESGGNWSINSGNGYYGGLQFSLPTWKAVGGTGYPHQASKAEQVKRGQILQARSGWGQWPACAFKLGLK